MLNYLDFKRTFEKYKGKPLAFYGISKTTGEILKCARDDFQIIGLLDGYHIRGELYGKQIISLEDAAQNKVVAIIVVARESSIAIIRKRIGDFCDKRGIELLDIYGNDLIHTNSSAHYEIEHHKKNLSDYLKAGIYLSRMLDLKFEIAKNMQIRNPKDFGFLYLAPIITDFVLWLYRKVYENNEKIILFGARDGFLIKHLFDELCRYRKDDTFQTIYFLTSRISTVNATVYSKKEAIDLLKKPFSGTIPEMMRTRFGIIVNDAQDIYEYLPLIIGNSKTNRSRYQKYIDKLGLQKGKKVYIDFIASGTCQNGIEKILGEKLHGYYFFKRPSEFQDLYVDSFYGYNNRNVLLSRGLILETILSSPASTLERFDENGEPIYCRELRTDEEIIMMNQIHCGIEQYFREYIQWIDMDTYQSSKNFDEMLLSFITPQLIQNSPMAGISFEDLFFGRITKFTDLL